ncbi:dual specificity protein phosphatase family protein [Listeria booriae]|uniref:Tyrosine specific protein phosphatases domain-containing protein n=1 Tax=Listeria booriae TaxID=1552123 RepID=A0A099VZJ6_9LIST|nr:dual specificity protein phosphatase family protein [Listeria booriae]KGL37588.1 hypothetical protein EP57_16295 [Listeria booriae]MBC1230795.1 hypothetical protein [Listeria booriae]MBC1559887.1 hypothetical protein [Listeria booriae]MBC1793049.1 hypothetical protein [Listeria booriae]MBC1800609.1 hypothetical protein [Listeria booriae]
MANYINEKRREIDFDPYTLPIIALPEVIATSFKPIGKNPIMIRIADKDKTFAPLQDPGKYQGVLEVHFNDINEEDDYWGLSKKESDEMVLFNKKHAEMIHDFVDQFSEISQIVVHCNAGVSRSSAVAMQLAEYTNDLDTYAKLREIKRYIPNTRVLAIMRGEEF